MTTGTIGHKAFRKDSGCQFLQAKEEECQIDDKSQYAIGAYVAVFHDGKDALLVPSSTHSVQKVGQPVLVQSPCDQYARQHGKQNGNGEWQEHDADIEDKGHHTACKPSR